MSIALRSSVNDLRALVEYDRALFEKFARQIRRLPWKEASRKRGIGHESLFDTLVHILNVREVWMAYIVRGRSTDAELESLFADTTRHPTDWKGFNAYSARVWKEVETTLGGLRADRLGRRVSVFWMPGKYTVRDGFFQASFEEAHHLGEVIGALWQDDVATSGMTWIDVRRPSKRRREALTRPRGVRVRAR